MSTCVNDRVTCVNDHVMCLQHVTHRLEISFGYAKHYLDVFRVMSNLQVTCVDECRRSRNVPTTYGQRMPAYASVCGTCESYDGIRRKIFNMLKFVKELGVLQRMPAYYDVYQRASACS